MKYNAVIWPTYTIITVFSGCQPLSNMSNKSNFFKSEITDILLLDIKFSSSLTDA